MDCVYAGGFCKNCGAALRSENTRRNCGPGVEPIPAGGPGTELKKILARVGIVAEPGCSCQEMSAQMDAWGDECGEHVAEIVEHLRAQAAARGLPFLDAAGRALVRVAIRNAKRAAGQA